MEIFTEIKSIIRNKFIKEISWSVLEKGLAGILVFTLNAVLANLLGPTEYGSWSYLHSILQIVGTVTIFGINASTMKHIAQFNKTLDLSNVFRSAFTLRISFSLFFSLVFFIIAQPLANVIGRPNLGIYFKLAVPLVFLSSLVGFIKNTFESLHRLKYAFFVNITENTMKLLGVVVFLPMLHNIPAIIYSYELAYLLAFVVGIVFFYKNFYQVTRSKNNSYLNQIFLYSLPFITTSISYTIIAQIDILMLGYFSTDTEVGIYSIAKQIIAKFPEIAVAISLGTMPVFAKLNHDNKEKLNQLLIKLIKINTILYCLVSLLIMSTAWFFIPLIFGPAFSASVIPLMIMVIFMVGKSFSAFFSSFLTYQGKADKRAKNLIISMILNLVLNIILIPRYGAVGAAIGTSISYLPYVILNWIEIKKIFSSYSTIDKSNC